MSNIVVPVRQRLIYADTWLLELFLALFTTVWAGGLVNPFIDTFSNSQAYSLLKHFPGGELGFGLAGMFIGGMSLYGTMFSTAPMRRWSIGFNGVFWVVTTVAIGFATLGNSGALTYFVLVCASNWLCWARLSFRGLH